MEKDCRECKLTTDDPQIWSTLRSAVRFAMCAASQLPGGDPTGVEDASASARLNKNMIMISLVG